MKALNRFLNGSKQNKLFAVVVIAICFGVIEFTTHFFSEMPTKMSGNAGELVAVVQSVQTDVRQKPVEEKSWYRAEPQTEIMRGDAIYSGVQSRSQVKMQSGGILELGEETLVVFDDVDGVTVPDVTRGQVKLKISGQMKIAISGEVTEFTGAQSELLLRADDQGGNVRALRGKIAVTRKGTSVRNLVTGQEMVLPAAPKSATRAPRIEIPKANDLISEVRISQKRKTVDPLPLELKPMPEPSVPVITAPVVEAPAPIVEPPPVVEAETAPPPPEPVKIKEALAIQDPALKIDRVMKVQEVYERRGQRALVPRIGLKSLKVPVALQWHGAEAADQVFVQVSKDKNFSKPWTEREATGRNLVINEWKPGRSYWRISRDRQAWSEAGEVVVKPTVAIAQNPSVAVLNDKVVVYPKGQGPEAQAKLRFQDGGLSKPRGWVLQGSNGTDFNPRKTKTVYISDSRVDIPLGRPGRYFFRVRSVAPGGEISRFSGPIEVTATKAIVPPVQIRQAKVEKKKREVAAVEKPTEKTEEKAPEPEIARQSSQMKTNVESNEPRLRPWYVTVEGGETALVSSEQIAGESDVASIHVVGLRGGYSAGNHSVSAAYHSKFGASNAQGSAQSNSRLEARYTRWWQTKLNFLRLGWTGGVERFNNAGGSTQFSKGYSAAKTGLGVNMFVGEKWKAGGDVLVGAWVDASRVYEFGGFVSYDFTRELAFGVGYRLSLFDAGSEASAPATLPYREAMGEAYSSLKFSF